MSNLSNYRSIILSIILVIVIALLVGWLIQEFNLAPSLSSNNHQPTLAPNYPVPINRSPDQSSPYPISTTTPVATLEFSTVLQPTFSKPANIVATIQSHIQDLNHPIPRSGLSVSFVDELHGWALINPSPANFRDTRNTPTSLFFTQDGGETWNWLSDAQLAGLDFVTQQIGWARREGAMAMTSDGGLTWQDFPLPADWLIQPWSVKNFDFANLQRGWVLLNAPSMGIEPIMPRIICTIDGGMTWLPVSFPCVEKIGSAPVLWMHIPIKLVGRQEAWLICDPHSTGAIQPADFHIPFGWVYYSQDDGQTWETVMQITLHDRYFEPQYRSDGKPSLDFLDSYNGWIGTGETSLFTTSNQGQSWRNVALPYFDNTNFYNLHVFSLSSGLAVWENSFGGVLAKTRDGGETWQPIFPPALPRQVQFFDAQSGVGLGSFPWQGNQFFRTSDGGRTWQLAGQVGKPFWRCSKPGSLERDCIAAIRSFDFINQEVGWALSISDSSELYHTQDGGETWMLLPDSPEYGYAISFVDEQVGFLVDNLGRLFTTRDAGRSFEPVNWNGTIPNANIFDFITSYHGAFAKDGGFYWTNDGGNSLKGVHLGDRIVDIELLPGGAIWLLSVEVTRTGRGEDIYLWYSPDDGEHWTRFNFGKDDPRLSPSIHFIDAKHGWIRTSNHLYVTTNGGHSWEMLR